MRIDDIISKATHTTGRALLTVSSLVLLGRQYGHNLAEFPILATADNMPDGMVEFAALMLVTYLLAAHFINWHTDAASYSQKNAQEAFERLRLQDGVFEATGTVDKPDYVNTHSEQLASANKTSKLSEKLVIDVLHLYIPVILGTLALASLIVGSFGF